MADVVQTSEENYTIEIAENSQPKQKHEQDGGHTRVVVALEEKWPGWPGESVFRILVPSQKVGGLIGRKGEFIKKMCEETRARIKVMEGTPGTPARAVMVSAREEPDISLPPAIDALLRVHKRICDGLDSDPAIASQVSGGNVSSRLLVPATQAGSLIGKQGANIKTIQDASNCIVRVLGPEDLPIFSLEDDRVVEIVGEPSRVHKAVELIAAQLRKFLVDRSVIGIFEVQMQPRHSQMEQNMPPFPPWGPPLGIPPNAGGGFGFGGAPHYMPPPRHENGFYQPPDFPPMETQQPHQGLSMYGREPPVGTHYPTNPQPQSAPVTQVTQHMQVPLSYADAVIGTEGANISYIRRASGATITIQETRGVPGEMTVEVNGTASQVQAAQQLIQNFMAEAAAAISAQNPVSGGLTDPGYNSYPQQGTIYSSPSSNVGAAPGTGGGGGGYGSVYSSNYWN